MQVLSVFHKSHNIIRATLEDSAGAAVTGAVVTITIRDKSGTALVTGATMVDGSDGTYDYTASNTVLPTVNEIYKAEITAVSGGNTRYAEVFVKNVLDTD